MLKVSLICFSLLIPCLLKTQTYVFFTDQSQLLNPTTGFSVTDCAADMNGDFLDDIVRVSSEALYIDFQQPDGSFNQKTFLVLFQNQPYWSICAGDLDNNGFNDLLFADGDAVSFVLANATGTGYTEFPDPEFIFSQRSTLSDIDNDGDLDAFVCHDLDQNHPYRNDGTGLMSLDQTLIETADRPGNYAAIWTDYDNDGHTDLYITKCKGGAQPGDPDRTNLLYRNNGDGTFTETGAQAGLDDNAQSWSTVFEDFDNDGDFDAFIVNHDQQNRFFRNNGDGTFTDIIDQTGIDPVDLGAWENAAGDFNNDGYVDIFSELFNEIYLNNGDLTFTGQQASITPGAIGDFNNDGFLDVYSFGSLKINQGNDNNWFKVNTVGFHGNRNGIGSRVEIHGAWGIQVREVRAGQSFSPMSSLQVHFGLGQHELIDSLVVKWPSDTVTVVRNPGINSTLTVYEAGCLLPPVDLTANGETTICPGDSVVLTAPAGYNRYTWSTGDTVQSIVATEPGLYRAMLGNGSGCFAFSEDVRISFYEDLPPVIESDGPSTVCEGESVELSIPAGQNPVWSNGETGLSISVTETGAYYVETEAKCGSELLTSETVIIEVLEAVEPLVQDVSIAQGDSVVLIAAGIEQGEYYWYDAPAGGTLLAVSDTFFTPPLGTTTTYYVEANNLFPGEILSGGKPDNSGSGGLPGSPGFSFFEVWEPFTLLSVKVYVPVTAPSGIRTIQLFNGSNQLLDQKAVILESPGEYVIDLGFEVPAGTLLSLRLPENNLYRNNGGVTYPYPIGESGQLTHSLAGSNYYYYFYDWKIQEPELWCVSDRIPVTVSISAGTEAPGDAGLNIYPVPAGDFLTVQSTLPFERLDLFDAAGRRQRQYFPNGTATTCLDLQGLAPGFYLLKATLRDRTWYRKITVR